VKLNDLLHTEIDSAKLEMDHNGHIRVTFGEEELAKINSYLKSSLERVYEDWTPIWNESIENMETYRTVKIPVPDGGQSFYPAPIARIPADQIIASVYNGIMRPRPVFSIDSYLDTKYQVPAAAMPQMMPGPIPATEVTSETLASDMQRGYDFVVRERIQLGQKLLKGLRGAVCGSPYWWKVVADPAKQTTIMPRVEGSTIDLNDKYEETRLRGDIVKWYLVPYTNAMYPLDAESINEAEWFAERVPMRPDELAKRYAVGDLFLVKDDDEAGQLISSTVDRRDMFRTRVAATTEHKNPNLPEQVCPVWLTWFYRDLRYVDPEETAKTGKKTWKIKRLSLLGNYHLGSGRLMDCFMNDYEHQERPYELIDQMDDGDCTVGRLKYHQTMFTYAAQAEIKAAHIANNIGFWHDPNAPDVADFFAGRAVLGAGDHIPGIKDKEWGTFIAGEGYHSLLDLMKFYLTMSQLDSRENDFTMGGRPPGRTSPNTVAQVYQHAEEVKTLMLARLSLKLSRLLRLDAETRRQYQPLGEVLPVWDEKSQQTLEIPFRFPVGGVLDNFRISLTAADEVMTQERDPQQVMLRKTALMADGEYIAKIIGAILNLQQPLPPSAVALFTKIAVRDQQAMRQLMGQMVTNEESFDLTPEIEAMITERNQVLQQQQQQAAAAAAAAQSQPPASPPGAAQTGAPPNAQGPPRPQAPPPMPQSGPRPVPGGPPAPPSQPPVPAPAGPPPEANAGAGAVPVQ
jgi:hypothetical protein